MPLGAGRTGAGVVVVLLTFLGIIAAEVGPPAGAGDPQLVSISVASAAADLVPAQRLRPLRSFTVIAGGDILTENAVLAAGEQAAAPGARYDFAPVFAPVAPLIAAADLAICHMEIPIGRPGERAGVHGRSPYGGNLLLAPHELAIGLRETGFDRCTTASNHSNDLGPAGIASTLDAFDSVGISHTGTARTAEESAAPHGAHLS